ncbi:MAG: PEGA domain-containing protein [Candidatus Sericytochromatia bacterium]|nr:PEGA domain-containing protein [Candidatus Sericytochromatia bacterium]
MQKKLLTALIAIGCTMSVIGCAAIMKGANEEVSFSSSEDAAKVFINGQDFGSTPLRIKLESNKTYNIEFRKAGFESKMFHITNNIGPGYVVADILMGFIPVIIDAASGAWYQLDQTNINAELKRQQ